MGSRYLILPSYKQFSYVLIRIGFWGLFLLLFSFELMAVSPEKIIYSTKNNKLFFISADTACIFQLEPGSQKVIPLVNLPSKPNDLVFSKTEEKLFVTMGGCNGQVAEISIRDRKITRVFSSAGHSPTAPVFSSDGQTLYVCNRFSNMVIAINIKTGRVVRSFQTIREPSTQILSKDGKYLFLGNFLPAGRSDGEKVNAVISYVNLNSNAQGTIDLPNGSNAIGGLTISPDGKYIYATHVLARFQIPTTQIERGWINSNALSIIDSESKMCVTTVLLDDIDQGFSNPWAVSCSSEGKFLLVTSMAGNELSVIERNNLHQKIDDYYLQKSDSYNKSGLTDDLSLMQSIGRIRVKLPGFGPRSIAIRGNSAFIAESYSNSLCEVDFSSYKLVSVVSLGENDLFSNPVKYGEMLFYSSEICFQNWQSCSSCHPNARIDGLNWDLMNDGLGNPKNVKSMLNSHSTPPVMWLGVRESAEVAVRSGMKYIMFTAVDEKKASAIDAYLRNLKPEPSPYLVKDNFSKVARRGEKIFEREGCINCHPSPLFTNLKKYDLKTGLGMDKDKEFDTPGLVEVWRTSPYLHDGRAKDINEAIQILFPNIYNRLSEKDRADLVEYILSL